MGRLDERRALVTGAGSGVGAAIATRLAAEGGRVALLDRDADAVGNVVAAIRDAGGQALAVEADVCERRLLAAGLEQAIGELGGLEIVVNNAGRWTVKPFLETTPDLWSAELDINFYGVLNVLHLVLGQLVEQQYGRVINVVSDSAKTGEPNVTLYAAAKAGVGGFSRALAKEVGRNGVTVNCLSLSTIDTPGAKRTFSAEQLDRMPRLYPLRRIGQPQDAAAATAFLASDDAAWITGQTISVNGGYAITP